MVLIDAVGDPIDTLGPKKFKQQNVFWRLVKNISLILFFSAIVFITINLPAYLIIGKFKFYPHLFAFDDAKQAQLSEASIKGEYKPTQKFPDNSIFIPKIGVSAPVVYDVGSDQVMDELASGAVHLNGSGHIGDGANIFITGHSSNYWWEEGDYNTVFALLPELEKDDLIYLTDEGKLKRFTVTEKQEVSKKDVDQYLTADSEQLTLMTCVPVGTNLRRLLIMAIPE